MRNISICISNTNSHPNNNLFQPGRIDDVRVKRNSDTRACRPHRRSFCFSDEKSELTHSKCS